MSQKKNRVVLSLTLAAICVGCSTQSDNSVDWSDFELIESSNQWLLDPSVGDLEEWQVLDRPTNIIFSPYHDLIVADSRDSRLIRITTSGELIEVIGREGDGPGEFNAPTEIAFEPNTSILWVVDHRASRVSRFNVEEHSSEYLDSFRLPLRPIQPAQNLVVQDSRSFWLITSGEKKISLIGDNGEVLNAFGDFDPPEFPNAQLKPANAGFLCRKSDNTIVYIGRLYPRLELWDPEGSMLMKLDILLPELEEMMGIRVSDPKIVGTPYISAVFLNEHSNRLYIHVVGKMSRSSFYELSSDTFQPLRCFQYDDLGIPLISQFVVESTQDSIRIFALDWESGIEVIQNY